MLVDVLDQHRRTHFSLRSSSAAAKNAEAVFRISLARRSSRSSVLPFELGDALCLSAGDARSVALVDLSLLDPVAQRLGVDPESPTRRKAPVLVAGSRRRSTAIRIARSRSSSGYFLGAAMTLILPWNESLHQTRHATVLATQIEYKVGW